PREPRIPGPPDAPLLASPDRSGDKIGQRERQRDFRYRGGNRIPPQIFFHQVNDAARETDPESGQAQHSTGYVEIQDPKNSVLPCFIRQTEQHRMQVPPKQRRPNCRKDHNDAYSHESPQIDHPTRTVSIRNTDKSVKTISNATRSRTHTISPAAIGNPF